MIDAKIAGEDLPPKWQQMSPVKRMKNRLSLKQAVESLNEKKKRSNSSTVNQDESYQKAKMFSSLISSQEFLVPEESKRNFHF